MKKGNRGPALLSSGTHRRHRFGGAMILAAAGLAVVAGIRMLKQRPGPTAADGGQFAGSETDIDDRIAESFPASDPPWHP